MRVLVVYSHPVETSYNATVHAQVVESLRTAGHDVDDCDLYAEEFSPLPHERGDAPAARPLQAARRWGDGALRMSA